jgi:hypothetical protein
MGLSVEMTSERAPSRLDYREILVSMELWLI